MIIVLGLTNKDKKYNVLLLRKKIHTHVHTHQNTNLLYKI